MINNIPESNGNIAKQQYCQIVILGCGLSGMLISLSLANLGISSTILETKICDEIYCVDDIRTTALTSESKDFLIQSNLWLLLEDFVSPIIDVYVVDNKAPRMLRFTRDLMNIDALGYMIKNSEFKKILLLAIRNHDLITLIDQCNDYTVSSQESCNIISFTDSTVINCELIILCNGINSKLHQRYFTHIVSKSYMQNAIAFNVSHSLPHEGTAVEHFMPSGPFAILPLTGDYYSSVVWTLPHDYALLIQNLPVDEFEYIIQRNFGDFLGEVKLEGKIGNFPLKAYIAKEYYYNRIVLVGDSAHLIHPLAGQGLNQSIKDIQTLAGLISTKNIDQRILSKYQELRQSDNMLMYLITDNINCIFSNHSPLLKALCREALSIAEYTPLIKAALLRYAMGKRY